MAAWCVVREAHAARAARAWRDAPPHDRRSCGAAQPRGRRRRGTRPRGEGLARRGRGTHPHRHGASVRAAPDRSHGLAPPRVRRDDRGRRPVHGPRLDQWVLPRRRPRRGGVPLARRAVASGLHGDRDPRRRFRVREGASRHIARAHGVEQPADDERPVALRKAGEDRRVDRPRGRDGHRQGAPGRVHPRGERPRRRALRGPRLPHHAARAGRGAPVRRGPRRRSRAPGDLRSRQPRHAPHRRAGRFSISTFRPSCCVRSTRARSSASATRNR